MNLDHLRAFIWLRWRLRVNQLKRGGTANTILLAMMAGAVVVAAAGLFLGGFLIGCFALAAARPAAVMYTWDGVVAAFLFVWAIGLLTELQRSEGLSLDRFLHLPVSPAGAFLVNYVSSLASVTLLLFAPGMIGLTLGLVFSQGPAMLLGLPLLAALLLAVTGVTYQFQGWLAAIMVNPRRRRTVIVSLTLGFILLAQAPNLVNVARPWEGPRNESQEYQARQAELTQALAKGEITPAEFQRRSDEEAKEFQQRSAGESARRREGAEATVRVVNTVLPPGWLPLGAAGLAEGSVVPALLGTLGLTLIGAASLWRAYRTTVRLYTGAGSSAGEGEMGRGGGKPGLPSPSPPLPLSPSSSSARMVEWRLPGVSEHAAGVAAAGLRGLLRAPEAKMMLLTPVILIVVFGGIAASAPGSPPGPVRPLIAFGAAAFILLTGAQLVGNQFGYDRAGFRAFVLAPVPRREVLLGKNLAAAPLVGGLAAGAVLLVQCVYPMRFDHLLATLAQVGAAYLLFCLLANGLSILAPIPIAPGAFQPSNVKLVPVLCHLGFLAVFPAVLAPTLVPLGVEVLLAEVWGVRGWPVALVLALGVLALAWLVYRKALTWQGDWLAAREQAVLEAVTSKSE